MEEMPHDKVPPRMHEPRGVPARAPVPLLANDSNEMTAIDDKMLGRPLAIESQKPGRIGDDDPTVLSVREEERRISASRAVVGDRPSGKSRALEPDRTQPAGSGPRRVDDALLPENDQSATVRTPAPMAPRGLSAERLSSNLPLVILLVMVALAVAVVGLYAGGVIRL